MARFYITLLLAALPLTGSAGLLTPGQALQRARAVIGRAADVRSGVGTPGGDIQPLDSAWQLRQSYTPGLYLFDGADGHGFVVAPASEHAPGVLAYGQDATLDLTVPAVRAWVDAAVQYVARVDSIGGADSDPDSLPTAVAPLLTTQWNQTSPYNSQCPLSYGRRSMTGCVATAMAQIIRANRYAQSTEVRNYMDGSTRRSFDFAEPFDWDLMPARLTDQSPSAEIQAVGRLMLGSGLAVNTSYAWNESAAYNEDVPYALTQYFGYNPDLTVYAWRSLYSNGDWDRLLCSELQAGRPLFYAGGIHAFVLDGVDANGLYHFNWGWGGACDGYYSLLSLTPGAGGTGAGSGNFTDHQLVVRAVPGSVTEAADIFHVAGSCTYAEGGLNTLFQLAGTPHDHIVYPWLLVQDAAGQRVYAHRMGAVPLQAYGYSAGRNGQQLPLGQMELPAGEYRVYPGIALSYAEQPQRAYAMPGAQPFVLLTVAADGTASYSNDVQGLPDVPEQTGGSSGVGDVFTPTGPAVYKCVRNNRLLIVTPQGTYTPDGIKFDANL